MTWNNYIVTFTTALGYEGDETLKDDPRPHEIRRYIRATSQADAKYRVVRKFILPEDAEIINVVRCN
jgi:hypothetical protein